MDDAQRLYDVLDRLVDSLIEGEGDHPDHRYSPLGSALMAMGWKGVGALHRAAGRGLGVLLTPARVRAELVSAAA